MNELVTYGQNYSFVPGIRVLFKSAAKFCDKITLINFNLPTDVIEFCKANEVNIIDANELALKYNVDVNLSPYTLKVIFFYLYIKHISKSTNMFMCDLTDVYIQKNVFDIIKNNKPYISSENNLIENCNTNTTWVNLCYNSDIFNIIRRKEILNGGMYLGNRVSLIELFKELCLELSQIISRIGNYLIPDQAALNKLVHFDFYRYNISNNFDLLNLAHYSNENLTYDKNGFKFKDGYPYVIHQYKVNSSFTNTLHNTFS